MNFNINIPGLKDVTVHCVKEIGEHVALDVSIPKKVHKCFTCRKMISKVREMGSKKLST